MKSVTKKIAAALIGIVLAAHQGFAQPDGRQSADVRAKIAVADLAKAISITDSATIQRLYSIQLWAAKSMDSLSALHGMNTVALRRDGKKVDREYETQLELLLTLEQWRKYSRWRDRKGK